MYLPMFHALLHGITSYVKGFNNVCNNIEQFILWQISIYNRRCNCWYDMKVSVYAIKNIIYWLIGQFIDTFLLYVYHSSNKAIAYDAPKNLQVHINVAISKAVVEDFPWMQRHITNGKHTIRFKFLYLHNFVKLATTKRQRRASLDTETTSCTYTVFVSTQPLEFIWCNDYYECKNYYEKYRSKKEPTQLQTWSYITT